MTMLTEKLATIAMLVALIPASANAQGGATGSIEFGYRHFTDSPAFAEQGAFRMYRDIPSGLFLQSANVLWNTSDNRMFMFLQGRELGEKDQSAGLSISQPGHFRFDANWGQLPHVYSTTARLPGTESARGVFELPLTRPDTNAIKALPLSEVGQTWKPLQLGLAFAARRDLDFQIDYQRVDKSGGRPIGTPWQFTNLREIPEPIEQTTHALKVSQSVARSSFQLQLAYDLSVFQNDLTAAIVDNPLRNTDALNNPARGRLALAPDNIAHTFSAAGAINLPRKTRVNVTANYGMRFQDQELLPHTINSAINTEPLGTLPRDIGGDVRTTMLNATVISRALPNVTVTGRYRYFDFDDRTPHLELAGRVVMDRSISLGKLERERYPFTKRNAGVDVAWRPVAPAQLQLGYGREGWTRDQHVRNVGSSAETIWRGAVSVTPVDWASMRASVVQARRRADEYVQISTAQNPLLRRFDQSDRDRTRVELRCEMFAFETLTLSGNLSTGKDEYPDAEFGLQSDETVAYGADVAWQALSNLSVAGGYLIETFEKQLSSLYRTPTQLANQTFRWIAGNDDEIATWYLAAETSIGAHLAVGLNVQRSDATLDMTASNPAAPTGGTASENTSATAGDYERIKQRIMPISAFVRYTPKPQWTLGLGFTYEDYKNQDWRTDDLSPVDGVNVLLGNDLLDYKAGFMSMTITYRPTLRRPSQTL